PQPKATDFFKQHNDPTTTTDIRLTKWGQLASQDMASIMNMVHSEAPNDTCPHNIFNADKA
ncbi:hypothetical protein NDU88_004117, partial [Pleurodeles waltl]